jgi:hypothetical protein
MDAGLPKSIGDRVAIVAPIINQMIEGFENGEAKDGVQAFQAAMLALITKFGLVEPRSVDVGKVGVHPDNREGAGLVPIDVHDLLLLIFNVGWNWKQVDGLACELPPNELGASWRQFNELLALGSDGMLAPCVADELEIVTVRGSHTTAAVRCYKFGSSGMHDELCVDGIVSQAKILDRQPSMSEPLLKGMRYDVIRWQLVAASPKLMDSLSRTGNAGHGVHRVQTTLQGCNRVHALALSEQQQGKEPNWDRIAAKASIGMAPQYRIVADQLCFFVKQWGGGVNGHILKDLEAYERTLKVKRKIAASDLKSLAKIELPDAPRYVPAMVKAMLNAPSNYVSDGTANLFTAADKNSLMHNGKNRAFAVEAHSIMNSTTAFLDAYASFGTVSKLKIVSDIEIRLAMHVHSKTSDTRTKFQSMLHVAEHVYNSMKVEDPNIPAWALLASMRTDARGDAKTPASSCMREVKASGAITPEDLCHLGFKIGSLVVAVDGISTLKYTIKDVSCEPIVFDEKESPTLTRAELILKYRVFEIAKEEVAYSR